MTTVERLEELKTVDIKEIERDSLPKYIHAVDLKKEQAAKKRESRQRRKEQKERRLNKQRFPAPSTNEQLTLLTEEEHFSDGSQTD